MADLRRYRELDKSADEKTKESMRLILPPEEFDASFSWRFEGRDKDGVYFSTMHYGALYYFDFLSNVPLINVRRRGARHYWQTGTMERAVDQMREDYSNWQKDITEQEEAPTAVEDEFGVNDIPF